jgi:hypothetical protein
MTSGLDIKEQVINAIPWQEIDRAIAKRDQHLGFLNVLLTILFAAALGLMFVQIPPQQLAMFRLMIVGLWLASVSIVTIDFSTFVKSVRALLLIDTLWCLPNGTSARFVKAGAHSLRFDTALGKVSISYKTVRDLALKTDLLIKP